MFAEIDILVEVLSEEFSKSLKAIVDCKVLISNVKRLICDIDYEIDENDFDIKCMVASITDLHESFIDKASIEQAIEVLKGFIEALKD